IDDVDGAVAVVFVGDPGGGSAARGGSEGGGEVVGTAQEAEDGAGLGSGVCDLDGEGKRACGSRRAGDGARGAERKARRQRAAGERPSIRSRAARSRKSGAVRAGQGRTGKLRGGDLQGCRGGIDSESGDVARHATARIAYHQVEERAIVGRRASGRRVGSGSGAADGRAI